MEMAEDEADGCWVVEERSGTSSLNKEGIIELCWMLRCN